MNKRKKETVNGFQNIELITSQSILNSCQEFRINQVIYAIFKGTIKQAGIDFKHSCHILLLTSRNGTALFKDTHTTRTTPCRAGSGRILPLTSPTGTTHFEATLTALSRAGSPRIIHQAWNQSDCLLQISTFPSAKDEII
jgi:hypothetical protein